MKKHTLFYTSTMTMDLAGGVQVAERTDCVVFQVCEVSKVAYVTELMGDDDSDEMIEAHDVWCKKMTLPEARLAYRKLIACGFSAL